MFLLQNLFDEDVIETDDFYWNLWGSDDDMPNFWDKRGNVQIEWYSDNPGRGAWSNIEDNPWQALGLLEQVKESYANLAGGKETKS